MFVPYSDLSNINVFLNEFYCADLLGSAFFLFAWHFCKENNYELCILIVNCFLSLLGLSWHNPKITPIYIK